MSVASWKKQYYPVNCGEMKTEREALTHSLRKWKGLRAAPMKKHGLVKAPYSPILTDKQLNQFRADGDTCALCDLYINAIHETCEDCPLSRQRHGFSCDEKLFSERYSPYTSFRDYDDPEPMITLLKAAIKTHLKKENA